MTTVAAGAGWWGAQRKAQLAWREAIALRREAEQLRAELGVLEVIDETKVHAIGLPWLGPYHWQWRVYLPPTYDYRLHLSGQGLPDNLEGNQDETSYDFQERGEVVLNARIEQVADDQWALICSTSSQRVARTTVTPFVYGWSPRLVLGVTPRERSVWEPSEHPILLRATFGPGKDGTAEASIAIWLEYLPRSGLSQSRDSGS